MSLVMEINAERREETGKGAAKQLRHAGIIPAIYYRNDEEPVNLALKLKEVQNLIAKRPPLVKVIWGQGEDNARECLIREIQYHPVTQLPVHIDLMGITRGVKVNATVPVKLIGNPVGVRTSGGILQQLVNEVDLECLPKDIPDSINIDIDNLKVGESIRLFSQEIEGIEWSSATDLTIATIVAPSISKTAASDASDSEEGDESNEESDDSEE